MTIDEMSEEEKKGAVMERLTERFENGQAAVLGCGNNCKYDYKYCNNYLEDCPTITEIYEKLAAYEDAEEQGRLIKLPCKVGDIVYCIFNRYTKCTHSNEEFDEYNCQGCEYECDSKKENYVQDVRAYSLDWIVTNLNNFGKTVFITKSEAAAKLKELRGIEHGNKRIKDNT